MEEEQTEYKNGCEFEAKVRKKQQIEVCKATRVVHCMKEDYDVYIGRFNSKIPAAKASNFRWGNPFRIGQHGTREQVIQKYEQWIRKQPELMQAAKKLKGMRLGCWCSPDGCHGDVLVKISQEE